MNMQIVVVLYVVSYNLYISYNIHLSALGMYT